MNAQDNSIDPLGSISPNLFGGASDKGPNRQENQDAFWIPESETPTEYGSLYMVADGVGGYEDGAIAADIATRVVRRVFYDLRQQGRPISSALQEAIERANLKINEETQIREIRRMGSTFVAVAVDQGAFTVAHVGDARAYLVRAGEMRQLTRDDSWVQKQVEAGIITQEEAANHEFRNVVTQALGNKPEVTVHISPAYQTESRDVLLLCSDGLYDALSANEMKSMMVEKPPEAAASALVAAAVAANAGDNVTAVVFRSSPFIPLAAEPTLVPGMLPMSEEATVPFSAEPTLVPGTLAMPEEATVPLPAAAPPTPAATKKRSKVPLWLIILAIVAIILMVGAVVFFLWQNSANRGQGGEDIGPTEAPTTELPAVLPEMTNTPILKTLVPTNTQEAPATETPSPETPTLEPTTTSVPPTSTVPAEVRGCTQDDNVFIWSSEAVTTNCEEFAFKVLIAGEEVIILNDPVLTGECKEGNFIHISSLSDPEVDGWALQNAVTVLNPGDTCP